ncbi:MAG: hypothetical protein ACOCT9_01855 [archaeon]
MLPPIFFKEKPVYALAQLANDEKVWYASLLAKEIDCTRPHMNNIMDKFKEKGLVETEEEGRVKKITLTSQGEDLAMEFQNILRRMERIDSKVKNKNEVEEEVDEEE